MGNTKPPPAFAEDGRLFGLEALLALLLLLGLRVELEGG